MKMLHVLLKIFDQDGGYEAAAEQQKKQRCGCKGTFYGGKATIADAMKYWMKFGLLDHMEMMQNMLSRIPYSIAGIKMIFFHLIGTH